MASLVASTSAYSESYDVTQRLWTMIAFEVFEPGPLRTAHVSQGRSRDLVSGGGGCTKLQNYKGPPCGFVWGSTSFRRRPPPLCKQTQPFVSGLKPAKEPCALDWIHIAAHGVRGHVPGPSDRSQHPCQSQARHPPGKQARRQGGGACHPHG